MLHQCIMTKLIRLPLQSDRNNESQSSPWSGAKESITAGLPGLTLPASGIKAGDIINDKLGGDC